MERNVLHAFSHWASTFEAAFGRYQRSENVSACGKSGSVRSNEPKDPPEFLNRAAEDHYLHREHLNGVAVLVPGCVTDPHHATVGLGA